jgi:hypothetical protein
MNEHMQKIFETEVLRKISGCKEREGGIGGSGKLKKAPKPRRMRWVTHA